MKNRTWRWFCTHIQGSRRDIEPWTSGWIGLISTSQQTMTYRSAIGMTWEFRTQVKHGPPADQWFYYDFCQTGTCRNTSWSVGKALVGHFDQEPVNKHKQPHGLSRIHRRMTWTFCVKRLFDETLEPTVQSTGGFVTRIKEQITVLFGLSSNMYMQRTSVNMFIYVSI